MTATLEELTRGALVLPPDQRISLAHQLLSSVEPSPEAGAEEAWEEEILRRIAEHDGGARTLAAADVFARAKEAAAEK